MTVHLKKLSVGSASIDSLKAWQSRRTKQGLQSFTLPGTGRADLLSYWKVVVCSGLSKDRSVYANRLLI